MLPSGIKPWTARLHHQTNNQYNHCTKQASICMVIIAQKGAQDRNGNCLVSGRGLRTSCGDVAVQYVAEPDPAIHYFNHKFTNSENLLAKMANKFSFEF